jgi:hypothetical protein
MDEWLEERRIVGTCKCPAKITRRITYGRANGKVTAQLVVKTTISEATTIHDGLEIEERD